MPTTSRLLSSIPQIEHIFGDAKETLPQPFSEGWLETKPRWKQVHGTHCAHVIGTAQECGDSDGFWTTVIGQKIGVLSADCVPILLARKDGGAVGAVHAGWRGTKARILEKLWEQLVIQGEKPNQWFAAIGPSIGPCCYEVSEELARDFEAEFREFDSKISVPKYRHLDLQSINEKILEKIGLEQIEVLGHCTLCRLNAQGQPIYKSYRRTGPGPGQYSLIRIRA